MLIYQDVLCQFIIEERTNGFPLALVTAHRMEWASLVIGLHVVVEPSLLDDPVLDDRTRRFVTYLFEILPLRAIYLEYFQDAPALDMLYRALTVDSKCAMLPMGTLRGWDRESQDSLMYVITRQRWQPRSSA